MAVDIDRFVDALLGDADQRSVSRRELRITLQEVEQEARHRAASILDSFRGVVNSGVDAGVFQREIWASEQAREERD